MKRVSKRGLFLLIVIALLLVLFGLSVSLFFPGTKPEPPPIAFTGTPVTSAGIGIMGDSESDEYRADDARGGEYSATTLNWMEQLVLRRGLNFGAWGTWGEPRRTGYEYNWARSGATTSSLLSLGEATGLAKQVAEGKVSYVFLWIGDNDFHLTNGTYKEIYDGSLSDSQLQDKINQTIKNITTAVDTVLAAGPVKMVVVTIADKSLSPEALVLFPDASKRKRFSDAVNAVNAGIENLATTRHITVVDTNKFARSVIDRVDDLGFLEVGSQKINLFIHGNEPHHVQLGDSSGHPGTVASGLIANALFIEPFNQSFGLNIQPLSDEEILLDAGIR
jgi:hypothetical protein